MTNVKVGRFWNAERRKFGLCQCDVVGMRVPV